MLTAQPSRQLDRMSNRRGDSAWLEALLRDDGTRFFVLAGLCPVIRSNEERSTAKLAWFTHKEIASLRLPTSEALFLGLDDSKSAVFAICVPEHMAKLAPGGTALLRPAVDLRSLAVQGSMSADEIVLAGEARSLWSWHLNARHCGHCGGTARSKDGGWKRKCWACGHEWFPRSDPAVIMLITDDGDNCLLGHADGFGDELYSTLAGFVEHGEDIETAVRREVMEETGVKVGAVRYQASQPWPFPHSLMIGCRGEALSKEITIDRQELTDARWFSRDDVRRMLKGAHDGGLKVPGDFTIANWLIRSFVNETA